MFQNIELYITYTYIKKFEKCVKLPLLSFIRNFWLLENVEISTQVLNRQLFELNDVETISFRRTISDWVGSSKPYAVRN